MLNFQTCLLSWKKENKIVDGDGPRFAARFKPEVHPTSLAQKCTPEVN